MTVDSSHQVRFANRADAGRRLGRWLSHSYGRDVVVIGLPRGGVPVAFEVAALLDAPLDILVIRKVGLPSNPELAMGAVGEGGVEFFDRPLISRAGVSRHQLAACAHRERSVIDEFGERLRRGRGRVDLTGRTVIIVDDGLATGASAQVACQIARGLGAAKVVLAVPVAPAETVRAFYGADEIACLETPDQFGFVGQYYDDFSPTSEKEVMALLDRAAARSSQRPTSGF